MSLGKTKTNKTNPEYYIYISYDNILMLLEDGWDRQRVYVVYLEKDLA